MIAWRKTISFAASVTAVVVSSLPYTTAFRLAVPTPCAPPSYRRRRQHQHQYRCLHCCAVNGIGPKLLSTTKMNDSAPKSSIMDIREILNLLERTYPVTPGGASDDEGKERWAKTRRYLYQYRASCINSSSKFSTNNDGIENSIPYNETVVTCELLHNNLHLPSRQERNKTKTPSKRSRRRLRREPITLLHVQRILSFLSSNFSNLPHLQAKILQESPSVATKEEINACFICETPLSITSMV